MHQTHATEEIAIVGMSALFAKAPNLSAYWQNILNKVNAVTEAADDWALPYFEPDSSENDRIYTRRGGFLKDLAEFDPLEFGIMPNAVDGGEPDQYLALKLARDALRDAGYEQRPFNPEKTGIILGRGTYVNRGYTTLLQHGMVVDQTLTLLRQVRPDLDEGAIASIRAELKASLPPFTTEMLPGLVPNNVTGRIANRLNLMGPNFIVDAACASSLIAVHLAIAELVSGRCDMMLAGGIHASTPPQIYMIFCQLGGLSRSDIHPFGRSASGTLLGEGMGAVVLKRLADAERDGDRIYAVIRSVGISSDGKALGLLAPRLEGEVLALQRAYRAGFDPDSIGLIEAHGTSIPLGDQTEIRALSQVFGPRAGKLPHCALGSVKSMIGHCIPAAGAAGLIKATLALYHKTLPPTLCDDVNPGLEIEQTPFYINSETRPWIHGHPNLPRRAGVNAFGFGGINAHAVLEEYQGNTVSFQSLCPQLPTELLVFSGTDTAELLKLLEQVQQLLQSQPQSISLADLAYTLSQHPVGPCRLAIVADSGQSLEQKLKQAREKLAQTPLTRWQTRDGVYYAQGAAPGKVAFLFPGEGAQYANMLADLCLYFPQVLAWFDLLDQTFWGERDYLPSSAIFPPPTSLTDSEQAQVEQRLFGMDLGSEAVFAACMALYQLLEECGVKADAMLGHSTGENAALFAAGVVQVQGRSQISGLMRQLNQIYRDLEAADQIPKGALLTVGAVAPEIVAETVAASAGRLHWAIDNCRNQAVLFGQPADIAAASAEFSKQGGICIPLPFDRAYHTPLFAEVATAFRAFYDGLDIRAAAVPLYSCATASVFPAEPDAIRELATHQWSNRVRFRETVTTLYDHGFRVFVEVGPSSNLTGFVQDSLRGQDLLAVASNSRRKPGLEQFQTLLGRLFANGVAVDFRPLYRDRPVTLRSLDSLFTGETVAGIVPAKSSLNLNMPVMRLSAERVESLQQPTSARTPDQLSAQSQTSQLSVDLVQPQSLASEAIPDPAIASLSVEALCLPPAAPDTDQRNFQPEYFPTYPILEDQVINAQAGVVAAHFGLMQAFLSSQAEVLTAFCQKLCQDNSLLSEPNRYGEPVSFTPLPSERDFLVAYPLLGRVIEQTSEKLVCDRHFTLQQDEFLHDHTLGGCPSRYQRELLALPVIPFTFSMEILAEAAHCLMGSPYWVIGMSNLRGSRWLTLDQEQLTLRIQAERQGTPDLEDYASVQVRIFQVEAGAAHGMLVFEGEVKLASQFLPAPPPLPFELESPQPTALADADLYKTGMFHGPRLQGVTHLIQWSQQGIEADLRVLPIDRFFSHTQSPIFQTDAGLLDAAGQLIGYWLTEQFGPAFNCFPFQVQTFHQYTAPLPSGTSIRCRGLIRFVSEQQIVASFDLLDSSQRVIARLEQWQDRYFTIPPHFSQCRLSPQTAYLSEAWMQAETGLYMRRMLPFPEHFLKDAWEIWQRVLVHLMLTPTERAHWYHLPSFGTKRVNWLLGRIAAKDAVRQWSQQAMGIDLAPIDIEIKTTELGKPYAQCLRLSDRPLPDLSISHSSSSHSGSEVVAAIAPLWGVQVGIDLESYTVEERHEFLALAFTESEQTWLQQVAPPAREMVMLSFWCAKEAAAKALGTGLQAAPQQWQIVNSSPHEGILEIAYADSRLWVKVWHTGAGLLAVCQIKNRVS